MPHGSGHHHDDFDLAAAMAGELPPPYCRSNWRPVVGALAVISVVVAVISVYEHFRPTDMAVGTAVAVGPVPASPVMPVAQTAMLPMPGAVGQTGFVPDAAVHLIAGTQSVGAPTAPGGTPFNVAAQRVRPSVVGIRAALGTPIAGQAMVERIGSGVAVGDGTHVVTCRHVVAGATSIMASPFGQPETPHPATLVASDNDLALLRFTDGTVLTPATLADSGSVRVGDWVLAVGHPFGLGLTVTAGIVGRRHGALTVPSGQQYTGLLQTDAPINEGSSGGPLVDLTGSVVGLNTAIYAPTGVFSGAGFAIPSDHVAAFIATQLGTVSTRPRSAAWWGLALSNPIGAGAVRGVVVQGVVPGGPADQAGLAAGDVLTAVAGQNVDGVDAVHRVQGQLQVGDWVPVQVWRNQQLQTVTVRTASGPA